MNAAFYGRRRFASWRESETIRVQIKQSLFNLWGVFDSICVE